MSTIHSNVPCLFFSICSVQSSVIGKCVVPSGKIGTVKIVCFLQLHRFVSSLSFFTVIAWSYNDRHCELKNACQNGCGLLRKESTKFAVMLTCSVFCTAGNISATADATAFNNKSYYLKRTVAQGQSLCWSYFNVGVRLQAHALSDFIARQATPSDRKLFGALHFGVTTKRSCYGTLISVRHKVEHVVKYLSSLVNSN